MNKKIVFNGIELSLPKYDASAVSLFDYLEKIATNLEEGLAEDDSNFQISIDVDFSTSEPPRHKIYANGITKKKIKEKVNKILNRTTPGEFNHVSGSVRVNLQVEDR